MCLLHPRLFDDDFFLSCKVVKSNPLCKNHFSLLPKLTVDSVALCYLYSNAHWLLWQKNCWIVYWRWSSVKSYWSCHIDYLILEFCWLLSSSSAVFIEDKRIYIGLLLTHNGTWKLRGFRILWELKTAIVRIILNFFWSACTHGSVQEINASVKTSTCNCTCKV